MNSEVQKRHADGWTIAVIVLLLGYMCMGRTFAYLGIPPLYIFVGEAVLASFVLFGPQLSRGKWPWIARKVPQLQKLKRVYYLLLAYGVFEILHGFYAGYPPLTTIRDFAFDYYPLYFFLGLWVGLREPLELPRFFRIFAWFNGIYGLIYILLLDHATWTIPGVSDRVVPVPVFGLPEYSCIALLGLLAFEKNLRKSWPLVILNGFVLLGMQIRAEWLAFALGLVVWAWRTKNFKRAVWGGVLLLAMFAFLAVSSISVEGPKSRGSGTISAEDLIGRAIAPVNENVAANYTSKYRTDLATTVWRTLWWAAIWEAVQHSASTALWGFGYGYPIEDLVPYLKNHFIESPHNAFFYALGYTGWIGVILFFWFLAEIARLLLSAGRARAEHFGIAAFVTFFSLSMFTPFFEVPYGGIPFYLITGLAAAPLLLRVRTAPESKPGLAPRVVSQV